MELCRNFSYFVCLFLSFQRGLLHKRKLDSETVTKARWKVICISTDASSIVRNMLLELSSSRIEVPKADTDPKLEKTLLPYVRARTVRVTAKRSQRIFCPCSTL